MSADLQVSSRDQGFHCDTCPGFLSSHRLNLKIYILVILVVELCAIVSTIK